MSKTCLHSDQLERTIEIPIEPQRIISLVPSQTELLFHLGLGERVAGNTKFCIHPEEWFRNKVRVGGTKKLDFQKISELNPDLIIANKEENNREDIERLQHDFPVWVSDINNLDSALEMIEQVGEITSSDATGLLLEIRIGFGKLKPIHPTKKTLYLIWKSPYMAAGPDTFIHDMMLRCGFENVMSETRYPELRKEEIIELNPELVLLSSEPFPFKEKHVVGLQQMLPSAEIRLIDGELFSWYGSRLKRAPSYFQSIIESL